jgi:hypothetical protein
VVCSVYQASSHKIDDYIQNISKQPKIKFIILFSKWKIKFIILSCKRKILRSG